MSAGTDVALALAGFYWSTGIWRLSPGKDTGSPHIHLKRTLVQEDDPLPIGCIWFDEAENLWNASTRSDHVFDVRTSQEEAEADLAEYIIALCGKPQ